MREAVTVTTGTQTAYGTRCNPPVCVRVIGHAGDCRPSWHAVSTNRCGVPLPIVNEPCARRAGHTTQGRGGCHRSRYALDNDRDAYWRAAHS